MLNDLLILSNLAVDLLYDKSLSLLQRQILLFIDSTHSHQVLQENDILFLKVPLHLLLNQAESIITSVCQL